jgi:hypothetical protein
MATATPSRRRRRVLVFMVRWGLPLIFTVGGVVLIVLGHAHVSDISDQASGSVFTSIPTDRDSVFSAAGVGSLLVALMVWMVGWFARMNIGDEKDRARDEAARDYYARTGRWPGEQGPRGSKL